MKIGFGISISVHLLVMIAFIIINWSRVIVHQSTSLVPYSRQVSLVSAGTQSPTPTRTEKIISTNQKSPQGKTIPASPKSSGSGTKSQSSAKGANVGKPGGVVTDVSFPHSYYLELVERKIESYFNPPVRKPNLVAEVHFELQKNGRISGLKLKKSSGNALFDQAAQRAVISAVPLPPLPAEFGFNQLGVTYIFLSE